MTMHHPIDADDLDILCELSNIGAGHAVTSLAALLGNRRVSLRVPRVEALPVDRLTELVGGDGAPAVGVGLDLEGTLVGEVLILFSAADALQVSALVTGEGGEAFTEMSRSALEEIGNILASSYLNALAQMVHGRLLPSTPRLVLGATPEVLKAVRRVPTGGEAALVLVNEFVIEGLEFIGHFLLFLEPASLEACLEAAKGWA